MKEHCEFKPISMFKWPRTFDILINHLQNLQIDVNFHINMLKLKIDMNQEKTGRFKQQTSVQLEK